MTMAMGERPRLPVAVAGRDATRASIAAEVRAEMARQHVSGTELGKLLGENQQWFSRRMNGDVGFESADLKIVADYLGVDIRRFTDVVQLRPGPDLSGPPEPPVGVEPTTYRLGVRDSSRADDDRVVIHMPARLRPVPAGANERAA